MSLGEGFGVRFVWVAGGGSPVESIGRTPRGSCNRTLLRRVLRRFSTSRCFLEKAPGKGFNIDRGS